MSWNLRPLAPSLNLPPSRPLPPPSSQRIRRSLAGPNINISRRAGPKSETSIAINRTDPLNIFAHSNDNNFFFGHLKYVTFDGGASWTTGRIGDGTDGLPFSFGDPTASFDSFGNLFVGYLGGPGVAVVLSTDGGRTFRSVGTFSARDQPTVVTGPGSVWVTYNDPQGGVSAAGAAVTGLGQVGNFSAAQQVPGSTSGFGNFGDIVVGPNGQLMVTYESPSGTTGPAQLFVSLDADGLGPGGFAPPVVLSNVNVGGFLPIPAQPSRTIDAEVALAWDRSGGPRNGLLYAVYTDAPSVLSSDTNIFVRTSNDNGATWGAPVRVNDDLGTNSQFFSKIALDQTTGAVAVSWYDCRNDTGSGAGDSDGRPNTDMEVFASTSTDGGLTWEQNVQVSAGPSNGIGRSFGNEYGDYMGLDFHAGVFWPCWPDNSNSTGDNANGRFQQFEIYTARVITGGTIAGTVTATLNSQGIKGATVTVQGGAGTFTTSTSFNGSYAVPGLANGNYTVRASATGFTDASIANLTVTSGITITANLSLVDDRTRITGRVTRSADGSAISGATVSASLNNQVVSIGQTDTNGNYILIGLGPANNYTVIALASGLGGSPQINIVVAQFVETPNVNFSLSPDRGAIIGRATKAIDGSAAAGVSIQAKQGGQNIGSAVTTDQNGSYITPPLLAGSYDVVATPTVTSGLSPQTVSNVTVNPGQTSVNVNFGLSPATGSIQGQVVRSTDNSALQGVALRLTQTGVTIATTQSDNNGNYTFSNLTTGTYDLTATLTGFVDAVQSALGVVAGQVLIRNIPMVPVTTGGGGGGNVTSTSLLVKAGVSMVTVPSNLADPSVASFFGAANVKVAKFDPTDARNINGYVLSPPFSFNLAPGEAYFVKAPADVTIPINGNAVPVSQNFTRTLPNATPSNPLWTLVGNPFVSAVTWDLNTITFSQNGSAPQPLNTLTADANAPVTFYGWKWNPAQNAYVLVCDPAVFAAATNVIFPGEGVFVLTKGSGVQLIIPAPGQQTRLVGRQPVSRPSARLSTEWTLALSAEAGTARTQSNLIGMGSSSGGRGVRLMSPPKPIGDSYLDIRFVSDDHDGGAAGAAKVDLHPSVTLNDGWQFDVVTDQSDTDVKLSWGSMAKVPSGYRLSLVDPTTGTRRAMRTTSGYVFRSGHGPLTSRRFRIELSTSADNLRLSSVNVAGSAGHYNVSFLLNRTADVTARVISPSGKVIRTIEGRGLRTGLNAILWDGRTTQGASLPRGVYLIDLVATEEDGGQVRAVKSATLK